MAKTLDRFTLGEPLSSSEVAVVYRATETLTTGVARPVLLKVFNPVAGDDRSGEFRFAAEVRNFAAIGEAPHVATLLSAAIIDKKTPWIAFTPASQTVDSQISDTPAEASVVARMIEEVLMGLSAIHAPGLLHNDLKPGNLLITPGSGCVISDLSLAAPPTAEITQQSDMVRFAAPEVFSREFGKLSPSTDLYALGHIAYELALGSRQWRAVFPQVFDPGTRARDAVNPAKWMAWHCSTQTRAPMVYEIQKNFPTSLGDLLARLIAKEPGQRFASAVEALQALRALHPGAPTTTPVTPPAGLSGSRTAMSATGGANPTFGAAASGARPAVTSSQTPATPVAAPAPASGPTYFVRLRNRQTGPFDLPTLQRHVRSGHISRLHQVSTDGQTWRPATSIDGLFGA